MKTVNNNNRRRWPTRLFFISATALGLYLGWLVLGRAPDPRYQRYFSGAARMEMPADAGSFVRKNMLYLFPDSPLAFEDIRLVYRGCEDGKLLLDLFLLDLDPEYAYLQRVAIPQAEKGVRLGKRTYVLHEANRRNARLAVVDRDDGFP